jgi:hypothetical protein
MARHPRRFLIATALSLALLGLPSRSLDAQPAPSASAEAMNVQLAAEHVARVGPSYLYPAHAVAPGLVNPDITQANICSPTWSTKTIRPPVTYTSRLKQQQLAPRHRQEPGALRGGSLHLARAGRPPARPAEPLARALGDACSAAHDPGPLPASPGRGQEQGRNGERAPSRGLRRHPDAQGGAVDHRHRLVQVLPGAGPPLSPGSPSSAGPSPRQSAGF